MKSGHLVRESHPQPSAAQVREALARVLASEPLRQSKRLQEMLAHVVEETLQGRGNAIRGKTIAEDLYGRSVTEEGDPENVVRVDARRLRQRLELYYATEGAADEVRICLKSGSYAPSFEATAPPPAPSTVSRAWLPRQRVLGLAVIAIAVIAVAAVVVSPLFRSTNGLADRDAEIRQILERRAVYNKSPAALQARNLAEQARDLIFPIFDIEHQRLAIEMFQRVVRLDPQYAGGYAGLAQTLATAAILSPGQDERRAFRAEATEAVWAANAIDPTSPWVQSAIAWVALAERDYASARSRSAAALQLAPDDPHVREFAGAVAQFSGDFDEAIAIVDPERFGAAPSARLANRNIYAACSFHLGAYRRAIDTFQIAADLGEPLSAPSLAYQAAALQALGDTDAAHRKVEQLLATWPDARLDAVLVAIYEHREDAEAVLDRLREAGWSPPSAVAKGTDRDGGP